MPAAGRSRSTFRTASFAFMLVVGLCAFAPVQAASAETPDRQLTQPRAQSVPGATGTKVDTVVRVKNPAGKRRAAVTANLYLIGKPYDIKLGAVRVPAIRAGKRITVKSTMKAPRSTPAGQYAVRVCLTGKHPGHCRTSKRTVKIAPARLGVAPSGLAFGDVTVGESAPQQTVRITNTGQSRTGPLSTTIEGGSSFAVTASTCDVSLSPGSSCDVAVRFDAASAGSASASLMVRGSAGGSATVALTGTGRTPSSISISEPSYDFGYTDIPDEHTFTITNDGESVTGTPTVSVAGDASFTVTSNTCTTTLSKGASCAVEVTYSRTGDVLQAAKLDVTAAPGGTATANLTGSPVALSVSPAEHDFGTVDVGSTSDAAAFTLTNHRRVPVTVGESASGPFAAGISCSGVTLPAGGTCAFTATFTPTTGGSVTGSVEYGSGGDTASVALTGAGSVPAAFAISPSTVDFGAYEVGGSAGASVLTVTNTGTKSAPVSSISVNSSAADFVVQGSDCPEVLGGGSSCTVTVNFGPLTNGDKTATVTVSGATGGSVALTGLGAPAGVSIVPNVYDFGDKPVGSSTVKTFRVVNTGQGGADINSVSSSFPFSLDTAGDFTCVLEVGTILPHRSCTISIAFRPTVPGSFSRTLTAGGSFGSASATMNGTGTPVATRASRSAALGAGRSGPVKLELIDGKPVATE